MGGVAVVRCVSVAVLLVVLGIAFVGCSADEDAEAPATDVRCERVREHVIDLRFAGAPPPDEAAHRAAMRRALGDEFLTSCGRWTDTQVACALAARDGDAAAACGATTAR